MNFAFWIKFWNVWILLGRFLIKKKKVWNFTRLVRTLLVKEKKIVKMTQITPHLVWNSTLFLLRNSPRFFYIEVFYKKYIMTFILGWDVSMEQINDSANPSFEKLKFYPTKHKPLFSAVCTVKTLWLASKVNFCKYFTIWFVLSHLF